VLDHSIRIRRHLTAPLGFASVSSARYPTVPDRRCPRQALDPLVAVVASGSTSAMSWSMATISMVRASTSLPDWKHMPPERHSTAELVDPE
jgi:hypothetical protein